MIEGAPHGELVQLHDSLASAGEPSGVLRVSLSNELVQLLSDQMYKSPSKAIEELVVNSYDADATQCRLAIPHVYDPAQSIVVFDDGIGMDHKGLVDLWHIGRSPKVADEVQRRAHRKFIGRFGIGKLASCAVANFATYVTRTPADGILGVTISFGAFAPNAEGSADPISLEVRSLPLDKVGIGQGILGQPAAVVGLDVATLWSDAFPHWTIVVLEGLKERVRKLTEPRLSWILRSAMPWQEGVFDLHLNGTKLQSTKETAHHVVDFSVSELPAGRLCNLNRDERDWKVEDDALVSTMFPEGVRGRVIVSEKTLNVGKSADLSRSHGFFVKVRKRLVNEQDDLFGLHPLSHTYYNRFRAEVEADDLHHHLTAPREGVEEDDALSAFQDLLLELFNEARWRYDEALREQAKQAARAREHERDWVSPRLVERPTADVLQSIASSDDAGPEADETWFYLAVPPTAELGEVVTQLYGSPRSGYRYAYENAGAGARLVTFDPGDGRFTINLDHELAREYAEDPKASVLLEEVAAAEALLEVYLREHDVPAHTIGDILEKRDLLLRSLVQDRLYSLGALAESLRKSADDERALEVALVAAIRGLGFVAKHISNAGEPDGIARYTDYPGGERKITLEAKASQNMPTLGAIDFAGLRQHALDTRYNADGTLLLTRQFPGDQRGDEAAAAERAVQNKVSCWTIDDLARLVEASEAKRVTARHVLDIVLRHFRPGDVHKAVEELLAQQPWDARVLYRAIIDALADLEGRLSDRRRTVQHVEARVTLQPGLEDVTGEQVERALRDLAGASRGILEVQNDNLTLLGAVEELRRRTADLTGDIGTPRRGGVVRKPEAVEDDEV